MSGCQKAYDTGFQDGFVAQMPRVERLHDMLCASIDRSSELEARLEDLLVYERSHEEADGPNLKTVSDGWVCAGCDDAPVFATKGALRHMQGCILFSTVAEKPRAIAPEAGHKSEGAQHTCVAAVNPGVVAPPCPACADFFAKNGHLPFQKVALPEGLRACLKVVEEGGIIISSNTCSEMELAFARAEERWWVDDQGMGYVARPKSKCRPTTHADGDRVFVASWANQHGTIKGWREDLAEWWVQLDDREKYPAWHSFGESVVVPAGEPNVKSSTAAVEDQLELAYWRFDALHKAHYRDVDRSLPGPMSERDAFKCIVRKLLAREREACAKICEANADWAREPGRMPPEVQSGSVGASLGLASEIRGRDTYRGVDGGERPALTEEGGRMRASGEKPCSAEGSHPRETGNGRVESRPVDHQFQKPDSAPTGGVGSDDGGPAVPRTRHSVELDAIESASRSGWTAAIERALEIIEHEDGQQRIYNRVATALRIQTSKAERGVTDRTIGTVHRDADPFQEMAAEGAPEDTASDKATGQVQAGARDPDSASASQPSTPRHASEAVLEEARARRARAFPERVKVMNAIMGEDRTNETTPLSDSDLDDLAREWPIERIQRLVDEVRRLRSAPRTDNSRPPTDAVRQAAFNLLAQEWPTDLRRQYFKALSDALRAEEDAARELRSGVCDYCKQGSPDTKLTVEEKTVLIHQTCHIAVIAEQQRVLRVDSAMHEHEIAERKASNAANERLLVRYGKCSERIWAMFPIDPLGEHPAHFNVERLEALLDKNLLVPSFRVAMAAEEHLTRLQELEEQVATPIPMFLTCPSCNARHIDEGEFATKVHHTHSCQSCGLTWRPAVVPTVGVQFLPGFKSGGQTP